MLLKPKSNGKDNADVRQRLNTFLDKSIPFELRHLMLREAVTDDDEVSRRLVNQLLERAAAGQADALAVQKLAEAEQMIEALKGGALRPATFIGRVETPPSQPARVEVRLPNGEFAMPMVADVELLATLHCGDGVVLDAQARSVLYRQATATQAGEIVRFERRLDERRLLASVRDHEPQAFLISDTLARQLDSNEIAAGRQLLVCTKRQIAFHAVEEDQGAPTYRYLMRGPIPNVVLHRDVGDPPRYIAEVLKHIRRELTRPQLGRKYRLRRSQTKLLEGVTGSGKTHSIEATIRAAYEDIGQHVGVPIDQLPMRVMRLRMAEVGSMYFAETDKGIDRFFDDVFRLADEKFVGPDGVEYELPVFVILEECDSLGRERSAGGEHVYDRIQGTLLERLDANSHRFGSRLIVVLATTNVPHLLDPAFLRRVGGTIEHFGRLTRKGLIAILQKHLAQLPIDETYGGDQGERERRLTRDVVHWFFGPEANDPGLVEVTYVGSSQPAVFRRRAFLTAGLVDRAVQQAAEAACDDEEEAGDDRVGITRELLLSAFDCQVRAIVDQLTIYNVGSHVTLPDGVRAAQVRRIDQPPLTSYELELAAS